MSDDNRDREEPRHEEKQCEEPEGQRRARAEDKVRYREHLKSGHYRRWLARSDYGADAEIEQTAKIDEASALAAGQFDKQVWQQQALETVQEAQQSLWALILCLSSCQNSAAEREFLSSLLAVTTISADDENTLNSIDRHLRSSETKDRFPDLTKELRLLRSKVENYRLVREIVEKADS